MDNVVIDLVLGAILIVSVVLGARRGLFKTLMSLVVVIAALLGAVLITNLLTQSVADRVYPMVEERILLQLNIPPTEAQEESVFDPEIASSRYEEILTLLSSLGLNEQTIRDIVSSGALSVYGLVQSAARALTRMIVQAVLLLVSFLILLFALKILTRAADRIFRLPVLHAANVIGGGAFGLIEAVLFIFLVLYLAPRFGIRYFAEHEEGTRLLAFFLTHSPKTLIALLSK